MMSLLLLVFVVGVVREGGADGGQHLAMEAARVAEVVEEGPFSRFCRQPDGQGRVEEAVLVHEGTDARSGTIIDC